MQTDVYDALHFPAVHATEYTQRVIRVFTVMAVLMVGILCMSHAPQIDRTIKIIVTVLMIALMAWSVFEFMTLQKKIFSPCDCGHEIKRGEDLHGLFFVTTLVAAEMALCCFFAKVEGMPLQSLRFNQSIVFNALTFLLPALTLSIFVISGRVAAYESKVRS
jgi:hypothetical protein